MSDLSRRQGWASRAVFFIARGCELVAITAILGLFGVVAINIFMRALFDASAAQINLMIPGAVELASYALLIAVFASLPAALERSLIKVDVLTGSMPRSVQNLLERFWFVVLFLFAAALAWLFAGEASVMLARGDVTQDWSIPLWILYAVITLECSAFAAVSFAIAVKPSILKPGVV